MDMPLPSSFHAPSIWYEDVPTPQKKPCGKVRLSSCPELSFPSSFSLTGAGEVQLPRSDVAEMPSAVAPESFMKSRRLNGRDLADGFFIRRILRMVGKEHKQLF